MRGMGSYFQSSPMDAAPLGAYYAEQVKPDPIPAPIVTQSTQPTTSLSGVSTGQALGLAAIAVLALQAWIGFEVGKRFNHPVAGAVSGALFNIYGVGAVVGYSALEKKYGWGRRATPNRRRRHRRR